jgi:hypothetical protein
MLSSELFATRPLRVAASVVAATLASCAVLVFTTSPAAPAADPSAAAASAPSCPTSGLVIWLNDEAGGGTAGSVYYKLEFTNLSPRPCTLLGYPGVSAANLPGGGGGGVGGGASREVVRKPRPVTLANGATASAVLRIVDAGALPSCAPVKVAGLRVYPPGQTRAKVVPFPFQACSREGKSDLIVRALAPGGP